MGFSEAVSSGFNNITNFEGRATRSEFWWFVLAVWVAEIVVQLIVQLLFNGTLYYIIWWIVWIIFTLALVSAGVRRLHDAGQPGWYVVFAFFCCLVLIPLYFWVQPSQGDNQYGPARTA